MPIFEYNGKKYNVDDKYIDSFKEEYPDASTVMERDGKKYRVKSADYGTFMSEAEQPKTEEQPAVPTQTEEAPTQQVEPEGTPLTEQDRERMTKQRDLADIARMSSRVGRIADDANERIDNMQKYGLGLGFGNTKKGDDVYNPESGKMEATYITPTGNKYTDKSTADAESLRYRQAADMTVAGQLRRANRKLEELKEKREQSAKRVLEETTEFNNTKLTGLGRALIGGQMYAGMQQGDKTNNALDVAIRQTEELIKDLKEQQDREQGIDVGFWRGFGRAAGDIRAWDFGLGDMKDAMTMLNADKLTGENATDSEREAYGEMMGALYEKQQAEQAYGNNAGFLNRAGVMTGEMLPFMVDFVATGGGFEGVDLFTKGATKAAAKVVGKEVAEKMAKEGIKTYVKENGMKGLGQLAADWTIKALGATADDLLVRAPLMTNTIQLGKTASDIIDRKLGDVVVNEDGTYDFSHDKTWGSAIWQGEANNIIENYSEMFGAHLDPVFSLKNMSKLANVIGAKRLGAVLAKADAGALGGITEQTHKLFNKIGVSDYFGEVSEEYYGQLWRTMLNLDDAYQQNPDGTRTNLFAMGQFHGDILGGMALSMGLIGAAKTSYSGAQYASMKHGVNKADARATELLGKDVWEPLKATLDLTTNENFGDVAESVVNDKDLTDEEKAAALTYMERSMIMRGFNLGTLAQNRGAKPDEDERTMDESYMDGYNAGGAQEMTDAKNMYDYQRKQMLDVVGTNEEALDGDYIDWLNEVRNARSSGTEQGERRAQVIMDFLNAKQVYEGMIQRVRDDIDGRIEQSNAMLDSRTNKTTGAIQGATMKQDDRRVYVISGVVKPFDDGSGIDHNASDGSIIVRDAATGKLEQVSPESILSVDEPLDPTAEKATAAEAIRRQMAEEAAGKIDGKVTFNQGDTYTITDENGQMQVQVVPNENGIIDNGDGTVNVTDGKSVFPIAKEVIQQQADEANMARVAEFEARRAAENAEGEQTELPYSVNDTFTLQDESGKEIHGEIQSITDDGVEVCTDEPLNGKRVQVVSVKDFEAMVRKAAGAKDAETSDVVSETPQKTPTDGEEQPTTALERIPKDEEGNPLYEQTDSDTAWDAIVEQTEGDEAMAQTVADGMAADKEAALKKAEKAKSKGGTTPAEKIAAEKERKAAIEAAKQELAIWQKISETGGRRRMAADAARKAEEERLRGERKEAERKAREAFGGVPDIVDDTPQNARARGYRRVNGHKVDRQEPIQAVQGKEVSVKFSSDVTRNGRVAVIDVSQLQPSHSQGGRNPLHFIDEAQPKERNDDASILSARKIAENIRPEEITSSVTAYTGAPTVNARGEVIQGNSRSDALRQMWKSYKEQAARYKQYLKDHADEFGVSAEDIDAMESPVLVNMLDVDDAEAIALGQYVAQDTESGGVERIKPKNASQKMGDDMRTFANLLLKSSDEEASFAELVDANGVDALKWMNQKGYITPTQYASAFDSKGNLTAEAKNDLRGIMYQGIFKGGSTRLEEMFNALPAKAQKGILATAYRDNNSPDGERMVEEIQSSIRAYYALSHDKQFMEAKNRKEVRAAVEMWKRQYHIDNVTGEGYLPADNFSNFALHLAAMYKGENQKIIQGTFNKLYDLIQGTQEENLFEQPDNTPRTLAQAIKEVLDIDYNGQIRGNVLAGDNTASQRGQQGSTGNTASGERIKDGERAADGAERADGDSRGSRNELGEKTAEPKPIGKGAFGNIYDQFKGKAKEAFDFLLRNKTGYLVGVFHRDEIGNIDLVYGDAPNAYKGKGLAHIIRKHVETLKDFSSVDDAVKTITDVIENGEVKNGSVPNTYDIEKGNYRVVVAADENGNWVLTAFDYINSAKKKGAATALPPSQTSDGAGAVAPNLSEGKGEKKSLETQMPNTPNEDVGKTDTAEEVADIVAKAKAEGTYMKTPNGEQSNLSERQWAQVRTKAFKKWFGDWENDPENASKVVDENGEPRVVYHGTSMSGFTVFNTIKPPKHWEFKMQLDFGTHFTVDENFSDAYAEGAKAGIYKTFLNIRNPKRIEDPLADTSMDAIESEGYDGVVYVPVSKCIFSDGDVRITYWPLSYIAFSPNQIKSATDNIGTFDAGDDDIRFHKNEETADIVAKAKADGAAPLSHNERVLRDAVVDRLREGGMEVIADAEEGQRVLDLANGGDVRLMSFGEPYDYGQYPLGRVEPGLAGKEVEIVHADADHGFANYGAAKAWAKENIAKTYGNEETGGKGDVRISNDAVDKFLSQSSVDESDNKDAHLAVLKVLPEVLKTSVDVETHPDFLKGEDGRRSPKNGINKDVLVHRLYGAVNIDGKAYRVKITLKEDVRNTKDPHAAHSYETTKIELLEGTLVKPEDNNPNTSNSISGVNLFENVGMSYNPGEKVLDASKKRTFGVRLEKPILYNPRAYISPVRGEWTKEKIKRRLRDLGGSGKGYSLAARLIAEFDSPEELSEHMFYHGTYYGGGALKPSIMMSDRDVERYGGGGYGEKYWGISVSRSKEVASNFSIHEGVHVYPVILAKNAKVIEMPEATDAADVEDHITELWKQGVDAVWIGDKNKGEQELCVLNPKAIVNIDSSDYYRYYKLGSEENPLRIIDKAGIEKLYDDALRFQEQKKSAPHKPIKPSRFAEGSFDLKDATQYEKEIEEYNERIKEFESSQEYKDWEQAKMEAYRNIRFFRTESGEAYGYTVGGRIYIDPRIATSETPIHEYAHLWASALRAGNVKEWKNVVNLMKGTSVWEEVKKRYPELKTDDEIADEVIARYSGRHGAERLREEAKKIAEAGGVFEKAEAISMLDRVKRALDKFWKGVCDFLHIHFTSAEEVADRVMKDLLDGVDPRKVSDKTLVGVHNLTEDKLRKAIKQGGLAAPSMGVIDTKNGIYSGYGEITLIPSADKIAKRTGKNIGTYAADAWTPIYPPVEKTFGRNGGDIVHNDIESVPKEMQSLTRNAINSFVDGRDADNLAYLYLQEKGKAPELVHAEGKYPKELHDEVRGILGKSDGIYNSTDEQKEKLLDLFIREVYDGNKEEFDNDIKNLIKKDEEFIEKHPNSSLAKDKQLDVDWMKEHGYDYEVLSRFVDGILRDAKTSGKVDERATMDAAQKYIKDNDLKSDFDLWKEKLNDRYQVKEVIFAGYKADGNRKYLPNTVENAVKVMKQDGRNASVGSASFSHFIASVLKPMGTLDQIRKKKGNLTGNYEDVEKFREKWQPVYDELTDKLQPGAGAFESYGMDRLEEAATQKNPKKYIKEEYGVDLTDEDINKLNGLIDAIKNEKPSVYFETKFMRPYGIDEFAAAVLPTSTSGEIKEALRNAGVRVFEYDKGKEGDRQRAFDEAIHSGDDIRFHENEEIADIVAKAKADGTYLKAPNGEQSKLSPRQWAQVRTKAFKKWFGDWEKSARIEKLRRSETVEITGKEITPSDDLKEYKKNALEYGKSLRGSYTNEDTGEVIDLTGGNKRGGIREILQHDYKDSEHLQSIAAIPQIIQKSIFIDELPNEDTANYPDVKSFSYYVCGLKIGGVDYTVKAVIANQNNGERYYDHHLSEIEKGQLLSALPTIQKAGAENNNPLSGIKDKRLLSILQTNASKVVDGNGEPRVVYHGTPHVGFGVFNTSGRFGGSRSTSRNTGVYTTDDRSLAYIYTAREDYNNKNDYTFSDWDGVGQVYSLYLNMKNPLVIECDGADFDEIRIGGRKSSTDAIVRKLRKGGFGKGYDGVVFNNVYDGDYTTDYVAFYPNQIKSATDNVGTFDAGNNDIRYQFVGERGAEAADHAEEVTTRLDNLSVAREMEEAKKDAKAIKMATGWERGADGKWRYEIEDGNIVENPEVERKVDDGEIWYQTTLGSIYDSPTLYSSYPQLKNLPVSIQKLNVGERGITSDDAMSLNIDLYMKQQKRQDVQKEIERIEASTEYREYAKFFEDDVRSSYKGREDEWRKDLIDAQHKFFDSELIKKYYNLKWGKGSTETVLGFDKHAESVIAHEIQHVIQHIEGFARGGNKESVRDSVEKIMKELEEDANISKESLEEYKRISTHLVRLQCARQWEKNPKSFLKSSAIYTAPGYYMGTPKKEQIAIGQKLAEKWMLDANKFVMSRYYYRDSSDYDEHDNEKLLSKWSKLMSKQYSDNRGAADKFDKLDKALRSMSSYELYRALAGEVEARNVQSRLGMTDEERRNSLASETEDVSREDQIFLFEDGGESRADEGMKFRPRVGGNSGYVGYSMSKRAAAAREAGRFPKTDFRKEYGVSQKALDALVEAGIIDGSEWHHTSMYGNKTPFFGWAEEAYADIYKENKAEIDKMVQRAASKDEKNPYRSFHDMETSGDYLSKEYREAESAESLRHLDETMPIYKKYRDADGNVAPEQEEVFRAELAAAEAKHNAKLEELRKQFPEDALKIEEDKNAEAWEKDHRRKERERKEALSDALTDFFEGKAGQTEEQAANEHFNSELTRYQNGEMDKNEMLHLGRPQGVMRAFLPNLPIVMRQRVIKKGSEKKHEVDVSAIRDMPQHLSSPIFVFQRSEDTIGVLTNMRDRNGKNVCVAIELKRQMQQGAEYLEVNDVRSFHGRDFKNIVEPIANNKTLKWVDKEKGLAYLSSASQPVQQEIDKQVLDAAAKVVKDFANPNISDGNIADENKKFRLLADDDPKAMELESLPESELVPVYRNVQAFEDDALGSPMAFTDAETGERRTLQGGKWNYSNPPQIKLTPEQRRQLDELNKNGYIMVDGKKTTELQINDGLKFVKPKTKDAQLQYFLKKSPEDKGLWAAYDPYDHAIETPLNTQFSEAYKRPNLVVVRSLIPKSEIDEPFHADYALLPTGAHQWNNGRTLYLSRWSKIDKVLTREEEAKLIDEYWKNNPGKREALKSHRDYNRFVPQVRRELEKMGYRFELDGRELTPEESLALDEQNWENRDVIPGREGHIPFISNDDIARINAKMAGRWVGEPKEAMEQAMTARVNELSERLNTPVRIVATEEEAATLPSARQRKSKGNYNTRTGEVTIVVPNNANVADIENTFIHEVVGHDGLRVLFPEKEKLDNALDELYRASNDSIRETIDRTTQKMHEANPSADREQLRRDATEEYAADLAGRIGEGGFEKMSAEERTFWGRLKAMLQKALQRLLDGLKITSRREWGDKEWAYVLHEAYKRKKNGGKPSVFDVADTIDMREKAGYDKAAQESEQSKANDEKLSDNDIMFRDGDSGEYREAMARDAYEMRLKSGLYQTQEALQDSMLGLKTAMNEILKAEGKKLHIEEVDGFENAYLGENRLSSTNMDEVNTTARQLFSPMLKEAARFARTADERAELTDYMMAKHGLERNRVMAERAAKKLFDEYQKAYPKGKKTLQDFTAECRERDYAGLTTLTGMDNVADAEIEAQRMVADYESLHDTTELWKGVNAVNKYTLRKMYDCGFTSKATYDDINGMYDYYIPLRGFDEKTGEETYAYLASKHSAFSAPIKTAKGRKSKADDPFAYMQSMMESAIMQGNRNVLVKQRFLNFALNHPSDLVSVSDLWLWHNDAADEWQPVNSGDITGTEQIEDDDSPAEVERKMRDFEAAIKQAAAKDPAHYKRQKDSPDIPYHVVESRDLRQHQVLVKRGGKDYILTVNGNPRAAQALNGLTNPDNDISGEIGKMMRGVERVNRWLSSVYTTRNPDFVVSNFLRDMMYANTMVWVKESPSYALSFMNNVRKVNPAKMKILLAKHRNGKLDMNNETEKMFLLFMSNGGETGYVSARDIEKHKSAIKRELKKHNGQIPIRTAWDWLGERLDEYNRAVENCARFAAFVTSRNAGRSIDRSIWDAKEISVNFNKKGSGAKFISANGQTALGSHAAFVAGFGRSFYVFWNAAIQGTTNFGRQAVRHPKKAIAGAAGMYLLSMIMAAIGGDDDDEDGKSDYYNLPEVIRRNNIVFRLPWMDKQWISIPLSQEYRPIYGLGELTMSVMSGKEHYTAGELAHQVASLVSRTLPLDLMEGGGGWHAFAWTFAKPAMEAYANESWTGLPIYKDNDYNKNMPEWTKAYKSANKQLVAATKWLNEATGGDNYTSGKVDLNPARIEYLLNGYLGGYASLVDKLIKTGETILGEREYDPRSIPLWNRVVKSGDERTEYRAVNNEYFRLKDEHDRLRNRLRGYERDTDYGIFDYAEKIDFIYNSPEYERYEIFEDYSGSIDDIAEELKDPTLKDDERKELEEEMFSIKKELVGEANATRGR